jgi:hypothetical protein
MHPFGTGGGWPGVALVSMASARLGAAKRSAMGVPIGVGTRGLGRSSCRSRGCGPGAICRPCSSHADGCSSSVAALSCSPLGRSRSRDKARQRSRANCECFGGRAETGANAQCTCSPIQARALAAGHSIIGWLRGLGRVVDLARPDCLSRSLTLERVVTLLDAPRGAQRAGHDPGAGSPGEEPFCSVCSSMAARSRRTALRSCGLPMPKNHPLRVRAIVKCCGFGNEE